MFENIYGHENQKILLENAIKNDKVAHSYLFFGNEGIGKKKVASEFAKGLLGCDNLETCVDYKYITRLSGKKDILADQIREEITDDVSKRPISCSRKVYIIDDAEYLNDISQNILLKTLEEPPSYIVIIMIASSISSILPTILSRVSKVEFTGLSSKDMEKYLLDNSINVNSKIVEFAGGAIGKLNYIINSDIIENLYKVDDLICDIVNKDRVGVLIKRNEIDFSNIIYLEYLEFSLFSNKLYASSLKIKDAILRLKMNGNYDIVIDNMLLKCIESA